MRVVPSQRQNLWGNDNGGIISSEVASVCNTPNLRAGDWQKCIFNGQKFGPSPFSEEVIQNPRGRRAAMSKVHLQRSNCRSSDGTSRYLD